MGYVFEPRGAGEIRLWWLISDAKALRGGVPIHRMQLAASEVVLVNHVLGSEDCAIHAADALEFDRKLTTIVA